MEDAVAALRRFNRSFTPRIGVLDESFLGLGRPVAAARTLFEIGLHDGEGGLIVQDLRRLLGADSGYVSRLLRQLEGDGLISLRVDPSDGRRRIAHLTETGRSTWAELDRRSDAIASGLLAGLTDTQIGRLTSVLATADGLLRCASIETEVVDPSGDAATTALRAYFDELDRRFPDGFVEPADPAAESERMSAPNGAFVVLRDDDAVVGCGGLQLLDARRAEIKRMWLHPEVRGLGMGGRLLADLESIAIESGRREVVLDTNGVLVEAIALYRSAGYEPIERYNANPDADHWFGKDLGPLHRRGGR